jgi:23S rRNA (guanosine2251-2'-O)-methyltransferase
MARDRTTRRRDAGVREEGPLTVYGANAVLELLRSEVACQRLHLGPGAREAELRAAASARGIAVQAVDRPALDRLAGSPHHQGAVAITAPFRYLPLERLAEPPCPGVLALDGVQDPRNLGAILRTARALGIGGVVLPRDHSVGVTPTVVAASAGCLFGLRIARVPNLVRALEELKRMGFWPIALLPREGTDVRDFTAPPRPVLVAGGEGEGLRPLVRRTCDFAVSIPMAEGVESLNVAVAVGIALFEMLRRGSS